MRVYPSTKFSGAPDANADPDGDGYTNAQEFALNTDPQDPASALLVTDMEVIEQDVVLTFKSAPNRSYQIEQSTISPNGPWSAAVQNIPGNGSDVAVTIKEGATTLAVFYQVALQP